MSDTESPHSERNLDSSTAPISRSLIIKGVLIILLFGLLQIPLMMINGALKERRAMSIYGGRFTPEAWKESQFVSNPRFDRYLEFRRFLHDYNLIGMTRAEVDQLLGTKTQYTLVKTFCGNAYLGFELKFENDKVKCWRFVTHTDLSPPVWVSTNMVLPTYDRRSMRPKTKL